MARPIYFDARWMGPYGIGRFATELFERIPGLTPVAVRGPQRISSIDPLTLAIALRDKRDGCFFSPGFTAPLTSRVPVVITLHDVIDMRVRQLGGSFRRAYFSAIVRPIARRARKIFTVSNYSRADIAEWAGLPLERVRVVGNGVSADFQPQSEPTQHEKFFLHVGRRVRYKNIDGLLRAFACTGLQTEFSVMFTGSPDPETVRQAKALGVADRIKFSGFVTDLQLADLYRRSTALVFPSFIEGFGLPVAEAMACGTPVITSSVTSMPEVTGGPENAILVPPDATEELTAAMIRVAGDEALRLRLRERGIAYARRYQWSQVADRVAAELNAIDG